jgi:hypothetical protein
MDPQEVGWGVRAGLLWLRTGTSGGIVCKGYKHWNPIKCGHLLIRWGTVIFSRNTMLHEVSYWSIV